MAAGVTIGIVLASVKTVKLVRTLKEVERELFEGDLHRLEEQIDRFIEREKHPLTKATLSVHKSSALIYLGRWEEALAVLETVPKERARRLHPAYNLNLFYASLLCKEYGRAREIFAENENRFKSGGKEALARTVLLGRYHYFFDCPEESCRCFQQVLDAGVCPRVDGFALYFLGRLNLYQGNTEVGWQQIKKSVELAPQTFLPQEVADLKAENPRIDAPGSGRC